MSDLIVGSSNFVLIVLLLIVTVVVALYARARHQRGDITQTTLLVLVGASLEAFSWALYRGYWFVWRCIKLVYGETVAQVFFDNAWLVYIPTFGIYVGACLMLSPVTKQVFGKFWTTASAAIIVFLQVFGILLIATLKY